MSIFNGELAGWKDLSCSDSEGLLCFHDSRHFILVKIHAFSKMTHCNEIYDSFLRRVENEAAVLSVFDQVWYSVGKVWDVRYLTLKDVELKYVIFAHSTINGVPCSIEVTANSVDATSLFKAQFANFVSAIDFSALYNENAELQLEDTTVFVTGISDVFVHNVSNDTALFAGKDKYFVITTKELETDVLSTCCDLNPAILSDLNGQHVYYLENSGTKIAVNELKLKDSVLHVIGYYFNGCETTLEDNLRIFVGGELYV